MKWFGYSLMCILGLGGAFFGVFNVLFSDVFTASDWVSVIVYIIILYAALGFVGAIVWPKIARGMQWCLWIPAFLAVVLISISEIHRIHIHLSVLILAMFGSWLGLVAGTHMRGEHYSLLHAK